MFNKTEILHISLTLFFVFSLISTSSSQIKSSVGLEMSSPKYEFYKKNSHQDSIENKNNIKIRNISAPGKILIYSVSSVFGFLIGCSIDQLFTDGNHTGFYRSGLIGACVYPVISYEIIAKIRKINNPLHKWKVQFGSSFTFSNFENSKSKSNILIGFGRNYYFSKTYGLSWDIFFKTRGFLLSSKKVFYSMRDLSEIRHYNIDVSNYYFDISLLSKIKILNLAKSKINFLFGPSLSVPVFDEINFDLLFSEPYYNSVNTDFVYHIYEPENVKNFLNVSLGIEYKIGKIILQAKYFRTINSTHQIYFLDDRSRLDTFDITLCYNL